MTQEEKAKSYDEAIRKAKITLGCCNSASIITKNTVYGIFPELRESEEEKINEDEKIRKAIHIYLDWLDGRRDYAPKGVYSIKDMISWLKKQGEKKSIFNADDWYVSKVDGKIHNAKLTEKQDEEKSIDEVEPKFKPGDWIIFNGLILHIDEVVNGYYRTTSIGDGIHNSYDWDIDNAARLWTIEEARVGAVLVDEDNNIGIYVGKNNDFWHSCIYLGCDNYLHGINVGAYHKHKNTKPATKEQRDLLFSKMKEEGYKWDAEKQKVKTIEQNPAESTKDYNDIDPHFGIPVEDLMSTDKTEPKFKVGNWIINGSRDICLIIDIDLENGYYICESNRFGNIDGDIDLTDKAFHLWTIADAKDGDVLTNGESIVIFKQIVEPKYRQHIEAYIGLDWGCNIQVTSEPWLLGIDKAMPANKVQRDQLFQKIKESGYEWDAEKKEVKRIEPKTLDADKVIKWLKNTIKQKSENYGVYKETRLILPYNSTEELINDFKEDFGL